MHTIGQRTVFMIISLLSVTCFGQPLSSAGVKIMKKTYLNSNRNRYTQQLFFDNGLGDVIQEVQIGPTPDGRDLVVGHEFDAYRRENKIWLPIPENTGGAYLSGTTLKSHAISFYGDNLPYRETEYDEFNWNRPIKQYQPGTIRRRYSKKVSYSYQKDSGLKVTINGTGSISISRRNDLFCAKTTDEDNRVNATKSNAAGQIIIEEVADGKTLYVYDHKGNIRYILPPILYDYLSTVNTVVYDTNDKMQKYAYIYRYDERNNCIYKKLPGCSPNYYVYDKAGNCILSQDGYQRSEGRWVYTIPDKFGRTCLVGTCNNSVSYSSEPLKNVTVYAHFTGATNARKGYNINGFSPSSSTVLCVYYYDNYTFIGSNSVPSTLNYASEGIGQRDQTAHHGLLTGSIVSSTKANGALGYFYSAIYYDKYRRPVQKRSTNLLGGLNVETTTFTFTGEPERQIVHVYRGSTAASSVLCADYQNVYDFQHSNKLHHRILTLRNPDGSAIHTDTIQRLTYNDFGQIEKLERGGQMADVSFEYDLLQGSLRQIDSDGIFHQEMFREDNSSSPLYNGSISSMEWALYGEGLTRKYQYQYDNMNRLTQATYSQDPNPMMARSVMSQSTTDGSLLNLIPTSSTTSTSPSSSSNLYNETITYDKHGNILTLQRRGLTNSRTYGLIDDLSVTYSGNQKKSVRDNASDLTYDGASDFVDGADTTDEYTYSPNGSLTMDQNRGITGIQYDLLGNLQKVIFTGNRSIEYLYTADGTKLRSVYRRPSTPSSLLYINDTIDYVCGLEIKNRQLVSYQFDGGYASFANGSYSDWHYYIHDYMGNVRMVVNRDGTVEQKTHYYPYGGVIGDISTNHSFQKYKFEGKELDRSFGLDWYDIHARQYDAIGVPSWNKVDALAEKYPHLSPYVFAGGNPVNYGDYNGERTIFINGFTHNINEMSKESYWAPHVVKQFQQLVGAGSSEFIDGSVGGLYTLGFASTWIPWVREAYGYLQAKGREKEIINSLREKGGEIVEPLIIVSHSMGSAYSKGFLKRIMEYVNSHKEECEGFSAIEYDLAPYQPELQSTVDHVETYQYSHSDDNVAGHNAMSGAKYMIRESIKDSNQGHGNGSFLESIKDLPQGKYKLIDGEWVYVTQ